MHGTSQTSEGEPMGVSTISEETKKAILEMDAKDIRQKRIATDLGVSPASVSRIIRSQPKEDGAVEDKPHSEGEIDLKALETLIVEEGYRQGLYITVKTAKLFDRRSYDQ